MNVRTVALGCAILSVLALLGIYQWPALLDGLMPLPLVGQAGADVDGYPLRTVDRPALRKLLKDGSYQRLTWHIERLQAELERDWHTEYWILDATDALGTGERELQPAFDEWVAASPDSFAPYLARGVYWVAAAYLERGSKSAKDTPQANMAAMRQALAKAREDLDQALRIKPTLVTAFRKKISANMAVGNYAGRDEDFRLAKAACPHCVQHRLMYIQALEPRWGGSYAQMDQLAIDERDAENARTRFLAGFADLDRVHILRKEDRTDEALLILDRMFSLGDYWAFLLERAHVREKRKEWALAQADLDRASELRPVYPDTLFTRARVQIHTRQWEGAGTDLLAALQAEPSSSIGRDLLPRVIRGLVYEGWQHHVGGRRDEALRLYDLAAALDPENKEVQGRRANVLAGSGATSDAAVAQMQEKADAAPDDFNGVLELDHALASQRKFDEVVQLWDKFIAGHPDHAQAHLERGGAYYQWGKRAEALIDARRACELGSSEGCLRAKQLGGG